MKKLLITAALITLSAGAAQAQVSLNVGINEPAYEPVRTVYYPTYVNDRHRDYDWNYWHHQQELREEAEHREHEHHDNGKHLGHYKKGHDKHGDRD